MFPLGRDYLGDNIYMLKGIPDDPTPENFPAVPIDLSLANWCAAAAKVACPQIGTSVAGVN